MARRLILIHGRSQQNKDPDQLKRDWLDTLHRGLAAAGLELPLPESHIHFPFYGDTLAQLAADPDAPDVVEVLVRGDGDDSPTDLLQRAMLTESLRQQGIDEATIRSTIDPAVIERGPTDWRWVHAGLALLDRVDGLNAAGLALATNDVSKYLTIEGVRRRINRGVAAAFDLCEPDDEVVIVAHSLGTVVAYDLLLESAASRGWNVTDFVTIGSPLGMVAVQQKYRPLRHPAGVARWFNAYDPRDIVALHPLDQDNFSIDPPIENHGSVVNETFNRHGIVGYLDDPSISKYIHRALVPPPDH